MTNLASLQVIHCDRWATSTMSQDGFFKHYQNWDPDALPENLKIKDFPPENSFPESLQRHHQV